MPETVPTCLSCFFVNKGWSLHLWPRSCWECRWLPAWHLLPTSGFLCLYCLCSQWCFGLVRLWKSRGAIPFVEDPGIPNFDSQLTTCEIPLNTRQRYLGIWLRTPRSSTWNQTEEFTMPKFPTRPKKILVSKRLLQKNTLFQSKNTWFSPINYINFVQKLHPTVDGRYPAPPEIYKPPVNYGEFSISSTGAGFPSTTAMEAPWLLPQVAQLQLAHAPLRGTEELRGGIAGLIGLHGVGDLELS